MLATLGEEGKQKTGGGVVEEQKEQREGKREVKGGGGGGDEKVGTHLLNISLVNVRCIYHYVKRVIIHNKFSKLE